MKRIVLIGQSLTLAKCAELIRNNDKDAEIIIWGTEANLPVQESRLFGLFEQEAKFPALYRNDSYYKDLRIEVILGKTITRINTKRRKITTEDKEQIAFDALVVSSLPQWKLPDVKGANKDGVGSCLRLSDVLYLKNVSEACQAIAVQATSLHGLENALSLARAGKQIYLILPHSTIFRLIRSNEYRDELFAKLEEKGIRIFLDNAVEEILGEGEARAVRLKSKKVIACDYVLFDQDRDDFRIFSEEELHQPQGRQAVNQQFLAGIENLYFCDRTSNQWTTISPLANQITEEAAQYQAQRAAASITGMPGEELSLKKSIDTIKFEGCQIQVYGDLSILEMSGFQDFITGENEGYAILRVSQQGLEAICTINCPGLAERIVSVAQDPEEIQKLWESFVDEHEPVIEENVEETNQSDPIQASEAAEGEDGIEDAAQQGERSENDQP